MASSAKSPDAFRTIGELSEELGVAQHILRYWETKFSQLKPLQRAGNRRYYRPTDVELARRIHQLLNEEGYTVKGVQKLLRKKADDAAPAPSPLSSEANSGGGGAPPMANSPGGFAQAPHPDGEVAQAPEPVAMPSDQPAPSPFAARLAAVRTGGASAGPKVDLDRLSSVRDRLRAALDA